MTGLIIAFIVICLLFVLYGFMIAPAHDSEDLPSCLLSDYAHRGLHNANIPENSMPAFSAACDSGYGIELDIQLSSDGRVVVFHDETLLRMCGIDKKVSDLTYEELSKLTLNNSSERIPLLEEVLFLVDGKVPLLIELKGTDKNTSLCDRAFELLDLYGGAFCIESFNPLLIGYVKRKRPEYKRGQLVTILKKKDANQPLPVRFMLSHMLLNFISRPHFIAFDMMKKPTVGILAASSVLGAKKFAWTVRSAEDYNSLKERGVLSIFENFTPSGDA